MTPKAAAAVGLRIIGIWLLVEAALGAVSVFGQHGAAMSGLPGTHRRFYDGNTSGNSIAELYLHDTYYVVSPLGFEAIRVGVHLILGLTFLLASKPLGRLVAHNLDTF